MTRFRPGQQIGVWRLDAHLGSGGNAEVWQAVGKSNKRCALKLLRVRDPQSEPYQRFRDEISLLRSLGPVEGVLPLIDAHLPDRPTGKSPAWLAMPVATPLVEAIRNAKAAEEAVGPIAAIAETLTRLAQKSVYHRDIKPSNLYRYRGKWAIGDFGLAEFPGKRDLTEAGRKLGPAYFLAPEMLDHPETADAAPADVHSLAKSLWVLVTRKPYPPQGQLRLDIGNHRLASSVTHPRIHLIDRMISLCTSDDPSDRPDIAELARELAAWLEPIARVPALRDLTTIGGRINSKLSPSPTRDQSLQSPQEQSETILNRLTARLQVLADALARNTPCDGNVHDDLSVWTSFVGAHKQGDPLLVWKGGACVVVKAPPTPTPTPTPYPPTLRSGVAVELRDDGRTMIRAAHLVFRRDGLFEPIWKEERVVRAGWPSEDAAIADLTAGLISHSYSALRGFERAIGADH
jgi:serine/threonine protein kinase